MKKKRKKRSLGLFNKLCENKHFCAFFKGIQKLIVTTLVFTIVLNSLNLPLLAKAFYVPNETTNFENVEKDLSLIDRVEEVVSLRDEYSKTYIKENGMYEKDYFSEKVHYNDGFGFKEINNSLILDGDFYKNTSNIYSINLPKNLQKNNGVVLNYNNHSIKIYYDKTSIKTTLPNLNRNNVNLRDSLIYKLDYNIELEYQIAQDYVKENIILNSYIKNYEYDFFIDTDLRIEKIGNEYYFYDVNTLVYKMDEYLMYDANNNTSYDIKTCIEVIDKDTYKIKVIPSDEYLKNATYPVTIDPKVNIINGGLMDGLIYLQTADFQNESWEVRDIGTFQIANRINANENDDIKAYFELSIPSSYSIDLNEALNNNQFMYAYFTLQTEALNLNGKASIILNEVSWEGGQPNYNTELVRTEIDREEVSSNTAFDHRFNIYNLFKDKISNLSEDYYINAKVELMIDGEDNSTVTYNLGAELIGRKPYITVGYMDESGIKDYYTYENFNINKESSIYIAHNSGNLTYMYNDYESNKLINYSHIFNENKKTKNIGYGNGFNINYNEKIETYTNYYKLIKGDGSEVLFYPLEDSYISNDGSNTELIVLSNNTFEIISSTNTKKVYDSQGKLIKIYPNKEQTNIYIDLVYVNNQISKVIDNFGNKIVFEYDANNCLVKASIFNVNINNEVKLLKEIIYSYIDGDLTSILEIYNDNETETTSFIYSSLGHLDKVVKNSLGLEFSYDGQNRVTKVKKYGTTFENGDYVLFEYDSNGKKTRVIDSSGKSSSYTFDEYNHTISKEYKDGYVEFYKYLDIFYDQEGNVITSPNYKNNHKVIVKSSKFKNEYNQIENHGFEVTSNSIYGWNVGSNTVAYIDNNNYLYGSRVLKVKTTDDLGEVTQEIDVEEGKTYVVYGYIKNSSSSDTYITVKGIDGNITVINSQSPIKNSNNFLRYEYKFTSNYTGKAKLKLITSSSEYVCFDQIGINTNYIDTRYNYLENSSFENTSAWATILNNDLIDSDLYFNESLSEKAFVLQKGDTIYQTIDLVGQAGDSFVFGGYCFYENYTGKTTVRLKIYYEDGDTESNEFIFDENDINANLMMAKIKAKEDFVQIKMEIINNSPTSNAYLDNFAIYKEGFGVNISYDEEGNIEQTEDEINESFVKYEYDENGNITSITKNLGKANEDTTSYIYDEQNKLTKVISDNISTSMTYDEYGNIVLTEVSGEEEEIKTGFSKQTYNSSGLFVTSTEDVLGNNITYEYDEITNLINKIIFNNDQTTSYTYDHNNNITSVTEENTNKTIIYTYDSLGNISTITNKNHVYTFIYNKYNDISQIKIDDQVLLTNIYENEDGNGTYTSKITSKEYSYGTVLFEYDDERRINKVYRKIEGEILPLLELTYNDFGEIAIYKDYLENETYYYNYDYQKRLIEVKSTSGNNITYEYDELSRLISKTNIIGINEYEYNTDDQITSEDINNNLLQINYTYTQDSYKQLSVINFYVNNNALMNKSYTYETITKEASNTEYYTGRIKEVRYNVDDKEIRYEYTYDNRSNITMVKEYENNVLKYQEVNTYNDLCELVFQDITMDGINYGSNYVYDLNGNIMGYSIYDKESFDDIIFGEFYYNDFNELRTGIISNQLYENNYSSLGIPNIYNGYELSYVHDNLECVENYDQRIIYTYNASGIRTGKTIYNRATNKTTNIEYILDGTKIIKEIRTGEQNYVIEYYYDSSDKIVGFNYNNNDYFYIKDLQENITKIVDGYGNIMVEYYYSCYGYNIKTIDNSNMSLSTINPYRYRSYYQDNETGWYYLNSRYYDSNTCRFISMDDISYLGASNTINSYNLFTYCENNPVMFVDTSGNSVTEIIIIIVVIVVVIAFIVLVIQEICYAIEEKKFTEESVIDILNELPPKVRTPGSAGPMDYKFLKDDFCYNAVSFK